MLISNYQLGIIYSIGTYLHSENRFVIRHKDKYYIDILIPIFKTNPYIQNSRTQIQYVLKSSISQSQNLNPQSLPNWSSYNSKIKTLPVLSDYKDFLRAYIEIHSSLDYSTNIKIKNLKKNIKHFVYVYTVTKYFLKVLIIFYMTMLIQI